MNKRKLNIAIVAAFLIAGASATAQVVQQKVGDNPMTINPNAVLDLESSTKGLLLPRVELVNTDSFAPLTAHEEGMTVYNTANTTATEGETAVTPGYYYNDGTQWVRIANTDDIKTEPWFDQDTNEEATDNTQNIYQMGSVAIGKNEATAGVVLDVAGAVRGGDPEVLFDGLNGVDPNAIGTNSVAFGDGNEASGYNSVALGTGNKASGGRSVAMGNFTIASGEYSIAMGRGAIASGNSSTAMGGGTASGFHSTAMGGGTKASSMAETAIGSRNAITTGNADDFVETDALFQVGNSGFYINKSNAITVLKNAHTAIGVDGTEEDAKPTELLDLGGEATAGKGGLKIRNINSAAYTGNTTTDKIVVADADGVLKTVDVADVASEETNTTLAFNNETNILTYTNEEEDNPTIDLSPLKVEPWQVQGGTEKATANGQNIYQMGSVAIGKNEATEGVALDVQGAVRGGDPEVITGINGADPNAIGTNSVAFGQGNEASGENAVAFGKENKASGFGSTAMGNSTTASGANSLAKGYRTTASGENSTAMGQSTVASGKNSTAIGYLPTATGRTSIAMGHQTVASGGISTAMGFVTTASGENSTAMGQYSVASGANSTALGYFTNASGNISTAMGTGTTASGTNSTAMGSGTTASGTNSTAMGAGTRASSNVETAIGRLNAITTGDAEERVETDALFQVGNGISNGGTVERNNAITVLKNAHTAIGVDGTEEDAKPTELLDLGGEAEAGKGGLKIRNINSAAYEGDATTDKIVVADANGVLKTVDVADVAPTVNNIYNANGALTGQRHVDLNSNSLYFDGTDRTTFVDAAGRINQQATNPDVDAAVRLLNGGASLDIQQWNNGGATLSATGDATSLDISTHVTQSSAPITFNTSSGNGADAIERMIITGEGNVGIDEATPTEKLDIGAGNVRVRDINDNAGAATDKIVVADEDGVLKTVKAAMPQFFYMPSIIVPTSSAQLTTPAGVTGESFDDTTRQGTINLHGRYNAQFGTPVVSNSGSTTTLPVLPATELDYHITWYDDTVFENVTVSDTGIMTYKVIDGADITVGSFMNIVFSVK